MRSVCTFVQSGTAFSWFHWYWAVSSYPHKVRNCRGCVCSGTQYCMAYMGLPTNPPVYTFCRAKKREERIVDESVKRETRRKAS
jgi:hypothetical protein